ncbi:hypothetical protein HJC23_000444 [Cyclotella cryptica]|uniref:Uncharacterized protein n=1 Tax=Cyclotella cryptica TaxID=29204 RepID=A0ABD3QC88_9STRA
MIQGSTASALMQSDVPAEALARGVNNIINNTIGFVEMMTDNENCTVIPTDLMDGDHQFTDVPCCNR